MPPKNKGNLPENAEMPPVNTGYPQPANAGYPQPANAGYPQPANAGYSHPANTGGGLPTINTTRIGQNMVTEGSETRLGPQPLSIICRSCNQRIVTRVEFSPSMKTHLFAVLICLVFWPCMCLPYCCPICQNADHYCPKCNAYIGSHNI